MHCVGMTWRAPVRYVVDEVTSTGAQCEDDVASNDSWAHLEEEAPPPSASGRGDSGSRPPFIQGQVNHDEPRPVIEWY